MSMPSRIPDSVQRTGRWLEFRCSASERCGKGTFAVKNDFPPLTAFIRSLILGKGRKAFFSFKVNEANDEDIRYIFKTKRKAKSRRSKALLGTRSGSYGIFCSVLRQYARFCVAFSITDALGLYLPGKLSGLVTYIKAV